MTKKTPYKGPGADSEEKREPVSDIEIAVADSLKVLDLKWPIREADMPTANHVHRGPKPGGMRPCFVMNHEKRRFSKTNTRETSTF